MDSLVTTACFRDDFLDFPSDIDNDSDFDTNDAVVSPRHPRRAFSLLPRPSEFVEEEELEWISNKDAFPMFETFVGDILPNHTSISSSNNNNNNNSNSLLSPVSVLENSSTSCNSFNLGSNNSGGSNDCNVSNKSSHGSGTTIGAMISLTGIFKVPGKARSKQLRKPRREMTGERFQFMEKLKPCGKIGSKSSSIGRKCLHCGSEKTPQWRAGPLGPKTLCNACGVRYKSGRLVPEYRPASSPTFSSELHSNSHRKIVEMRRQKMDTDGEVEVEVKTVGFS